MAEYDVKQSLFVMVLPDGTEREYEDAKALLRLLTDFNEQVQKLSEGEEIVIRRFDR